jgi:AhpC/TSA family
MMIKKIFSTMFILAAASIAGAQSVTPPTTAPSQPSTSAPTQTPAQPKPTPIVPHTSLKVGQAAPDFTLPSTIAAADGRSVVRYKLSDFKGKKNVVLAFYVLAFTGG